MTGASRLDALVAPLRANVVSGAAVVARSAANIMEQLLDRPAGERPPDLHATLTQLAIGMLDAQPAMAPLVSMAASVLAAVEAAGEDVEAGRISALERLHSFREALKAGGERVAEHARPLLREGISVMTLSASSTVRTAILRAVEQHSVRVICLESRPMSEGQQLATQLAHAGVPVLYAVDAAAATLLAETDVVFVGVDSVGDEGIVNKIGTRVLLRAAAAAGVRSYALVDRSKLLPAGFPQPLDEQRPEGEVWRTPKGIRVWNRYFETAPSELLTGFVTDSGIMTPEEVDDLRRAIHVPEALLAWARGRAQGNNARPSGTTSLSTN